jgi:hypothetical protein
MRDEAGNKQGRSDCNAQHQGRPGKQGRQRAPDETITPLRFAQVRQNHGKRPVQRADKTQDDRPVSDQRITQQRSMQGIGNHRQGQADKRQQTAVTQPGDTFRQRFRQAAAHLRHVT